MYADVWGGKGDGKDKEAASFLNATENSAAHAVHVAAYIMSGMCAAGDVEMMNYHSLLEGDLDPTSLGPFTHPSASQPGFGVSGINSTAGYISPVASLLRMFASWFAVL
jgi:hypothetical protein